MMMCEFQQLQGNDQIAFLYDQGVYLGKRKEDRQVVLLFQLGSFYVEVYYKVYRKYISQISVSVSTMILDPYLQQINVEDLVNEI